MVSNVSPYPIPPPIRSQIILHPPDGVPPTEELEAAQEELRLLKARLLERSKKAGHDIRTIEESMRRMKEKDKGKAKATEKVKRERDRSVPPWGDAISLISDGEDSPMSSKRRGSAAASHKPLPARASIDRSVDESKKKKKKRKRDVDYEDSDLDLDARPRKSTPPVTNSHPHNHNHAPPVKAQKSVSLVSHAPKSIIGPDFSLPPPHPLLPLRPPIPPAPVAGPSKPTEVKEDFSKLKQPSQVPVTTFYTSIEPWIRPIRDEDIGFLEYTGDEVDPYVMPKLGRHYLEVWEEQDARGNFLTEPHPPAPPEAFQAPQPKWDPSTLGEGDLWNEDKGHGPLTERVISALVPMENNQWKGVKAAEDAMEGRPGGSGAAASKKEKMNVGDLETRIRDTMRFHGLLHDIPDYSEKVDDPIASALRQAQDELRKTIATNKARKARLIKVARDRLAYQEYLDAREFLDRNITNTFTKLQKKDMPKPVKRKKKDKDKDADSEETPVGPSPAALGLGPDVDNHLVVSENLKKWVDKRREWVDQIGGVLEQKQAENPGRLWGIPDTSIYEGLEEDVRRFMDGSVEDLVEVDSTQKGKGKAIDVDDAMDVG